jgi:cell division septation protein DedD
MKTVLWGIFISMFLLSAAAIDSTYAQEGSSSNLKLLPSQERIPRANHPGLPPEYIIPPIESPHYSPLEERDEPPPLPVVSDSPSFNALIVSSLERGKWYVQIGAYAMAEHVENAVNRAGTASPVIIHSVGTETNPMYRVLLGPFSQSESKDVMQRVRANGQDAFLRSGN